MAELRCNNCVHLKNGFCSKLNETLTNRLAKLFYGGAEGILAGTVTFPSECGIEKTQKEPQMQFFVLKNRSEEYEDELMLADPSLVLDNNDW